MKRKTGIDIRKLVLFATAWLMSCLFAGTVEAQFPAFKGQFTLQHKTRWGQAVLSAGDYRLSIMTTMSPAMVAVYDKKTGKQVATEVFQTRDKSTSGQTALLLDTVGTQQVIHSFRVAELGVVFISDPALARGRSSEEARKTQVAPVVPVVLAKK